LTVEVIAGSQGGTFVLIIRYNGVEVERSPDLLDKDAALAWDATSSYVDLTSGVNAGDPIVAAAAALTGGLDGAAPTDAEWETALSRHFKDLGPGQVSMPGRTTTQAHRDTLEHAIASNRVALLDGPDTAVVATLQTSGQSFRSAVDATLARFGIMMAPWVKVPGITLGTTRTVPPSAIVAGLIARNDGAEVNQNVPSAGDLGISRWAIDLSQTPWSDADRQTLNTSSISVIRDIYNSIRMYGWRTLVDPVTQPSWINFGNSRLHMTIAAEGHAVGERFVFDQLDGQGITINQFGAELTAILMPLFEAGALYGTTPEEAFFVDVGQQVNTPETIATNTLKAVISVRMSPFGELVQIEIVKVPVTEAVV
jgi:phage tail sheath protein FI